MSDNEVPDTLGGLEGDDFYRLVEVLMPFSETAFKELLDSDCGNFVLTALINVLPREALGPIIEHVRSHGCRKVARHPFGCRVLESLIKNCKDTQIDGLLEGPEGLIDNAKELASNRYGNFVVQSLLEYGSELKAKALVKKLLPELLRLAKHSIGSHVVQTVYQNSDTDRKRQIATKFFSEPGEDFCHVAATRYGSFVVEEFARACPGPEIWDQARFLLSKAPEPCFIDAKTEKPNKNFARVLETYGLPSVLEVQGKCA